MTDENYMSSLFVCLIIIMKTLILCVLFVIILELCVNVCTGLLDYREYKLSKISDITPRTCSKPGKMCKTCQKVVMCTAQENTFVETDVQTCGSGWYCAGDACTNSVPEPECDGTSDVPFSCTGVGMFPDPFDCQKYHICTKSKTGIVDSVEICPTNWAYDSISTYCKIRIQGACPGYPVPVCTQPGQSGALPNKTLYYMCVVITNPAGKTVLYPILKQCPNGSSFINNQCG